MLLRCVHSLGEIIQQAGDGAGADHPLRLLRLKIKEIRTQLKVLGRPVEVEQLIDAVDFLSVVRILCDQPHGDLRGACLSADFDELAPL